MRKRRVSALLCALFFGLSNLLSGALAVDTLDEMGVDPWGDLQGIQIPGPDGSFASPSPAPGEEQGYPVDILQPDMMAGQGGISVAALPPIPSGKKYKVFANSIAFMEPSAGFEYSMTSSSPIVETSLDTFTITFGAPSTASYSSSATFSLKATNSSDLSYYSVVIPVNMPNGEYESFTLSGYLISYFGIGLNSGASFSSFGYAPRLRVYVKGKQVGDTIMLSDNVGGTTSKGYLFKNAVYNISAYYNGSAITEIELRFCFSYAETIATLPLNSYASYVAPKVYFQSGNLGLSFQKLSVSVDISGGDDENPGSTAAEDQARHEETKGLLNSIIAWLTAIRDGIVNVATAIVELPGKIATAVLDGLKSLFIPSEDDLDDLTEKYRTLLSARLGFLWQASDWVVSFASDLLSAISSGEEAEFNFPGAGFDMGGEHYQLIESQAVDFSGNGIVQVVRPYLGTIVAFIVVAACANLFRDMVTAFISGKSYFDFLKGGGEG